MAKQDGDKPYIGDVGTPLKGPHDILTMGFSMVLLALVIGFVVGVLVWGILDLSIFLTGLVWTNLWGLFPVAWFPLVVCTAGGLVIGLWTKATHNEPESLDAVMAKVRTTGGYHINGIGKSVVSFLLPLVFGGSVGPEAGLTGLIAGACTWIGERLKGAGLAAKAVVQLTLSAALSAIFGTPFLGPVAAVGEGGMGERESASGSGARADSNADGAPNPDDYTFRRPVKIILYVAAAFGAFGGVALLGTFIHAGTGLPRFGAATVGSLECLWALPLIACGYLLGLLFHASVKVTGLIGKRLERFTVLRAVACGLVLGVVGMFLPNVMFAGEEQATELMASWAQTGMVVLLLTGAIKLFMTPFCLSMGWHGGNFFPSIFAGISFGYGLSLLTGADPLFCVTVVTSALMAAILRKPLMTLALLILCFPLNSLLWMGFAVLIAATLPLPRFLRDKEPDPAACGENELRHEEQS